MNLWPAVIIGGSVVGGIGIIVGIVYGIVYVARIAWTGH